MTKSPYFPQPAVVSTVAITSNAIAIAQLFDNAQHAAAGGVVLFSGTVRNHHAGKAVAYLEYEAFAPLALKQMQLIVDEACSKWLLSHAHCTHRIGKLAIGDSAIVVITSHAHRSQAYEANQYIMDRVKAEVPIWKNEFFIDGSSAWGNNATAINSK